MNASGLIGCSASAAVTASFAQGVVGDGHLIAGIQRQPTPIVAGDVGKLYNLIELGFTGAPGTTRTCDLGIRRPLLYPPELRRQCAGQSIQLDCRSGSLAATRTKSVPAPQLSVMV